MKTLIKLILLISILCNSCSIWWSIDSYADKLEYEWDVMVGSYYVRIDSVQLKKWHNRYFVRGNSNRFYYCFDDTTTFYIGDTIAFTDEILGKSIMKKIQTNKYENTSHSTPQ